MKICEICGYPADNTHHLIFGNGVRRLADRDGLTIDLCADCHMELHGNGVASVLSKMLGQAIWERDNPGETARDKFIARYGRSWL